MQDFVLNILTAKFDEETGVWAYKLGHMFRLYLRGWFVVDLVSVVPVDWACRGILVT